MLARGGWLILVAALFAGCADAEPDQSSPGPDTATVVLRGIVVDPELVPVGGAATFVDGNDTVVTTGTDGRFALGPLEPGAYALHVEKEGYAPRLLAVDLTSDAPDLVVQLEPTSTMVPHHETQVFASTIGCAFATPTSRVTCGLINSTTGSSPVPDSSVFQFQIGAPGLATLVVETQWRSTQLFARELSVNILDRDGDQTNCVTTKCYAESWGPSPVRFRLVPDARFNDATIYHPLPTDEGHRFNTYLMPPFGSNANNAVSVYLDQRVDSYLTFFYNRAAPDAFSALPDA